MTRFILSLAVIGLYFLACKPAATQLSQTRTVDQLVDDRNRNDSELCGTPAQDATDLPPWLAPFADRVVANSSEHRALGLGNRRGSRFQLRDTQ